MFGRLWISDSDGSHSIDLRKFGGSVVGDKIRSKIPYQLVDMSTGIRTGLPITPAVAYSRCVHHDPANSRFLIWECRGDNIANKGPDFCMKIWLVDEKTATTSSNCIPFGTSEIYRQYNKYYATAAGVFFSAAGYFQRKLPISRGIAGLYSFVDGKYARVLPGFIGNTVLSPDGCKLAFSHAWSAEDYEPDNGIHASVKVINLCSRKWLLDTTSGIPGVL